jgi:hypothetical protein
MALFTDGPFVTSSILSTVDREFLDIAKKEKVNVDGPSGNVLDEYTLDAGSEFQAYIQNFSGYLVGTGVNSNHLAAVLNISSAAINRPRALLQQIVVTEPNPIRRNFINWVKYSCLYDFYRSLSAQRTNEDKYLTRMAIYESEKRKKWNFLKGNGFPVVLSPFSRPGALWDAGAGVWGSANVSQTSGGTYPNDASYDVSITWVSLPAYISPINQNGGESAGSERATIDVTAGQVILVSLSGLNPPTGKMNPNTGTAQGIYSSANATGFNVYTGLKGGILYLQNNSPIPLTSGGFAFQGPPVLSGTVLNAGQPAQYDFSMQTMLWRA